MTLLELFSRIPDFRSRSGRRHELSDVLLMCIMGIMSGYYGYRELGRFVENHSKEFQQTFRLLHKVPSFVTIRSILQEIDFNSFNALFNQWASQYIQLDNKQTLSIDGKSIGSTVTDYDKPYQNFVSLVSIFASERGIILRCNKIESGKQSEIPSVQELIKAIDVEGQIFTIDALHCQKKRLK
jgi:hypothetical protein